MVVVVAKVVDKEINRALVKEVKEFNEGLEKFYLCKVKSKFKVLVYEIVDKEVTKVIE